MNKEKEAAQVRQHQDGKEDLRCTDRAAFIQQHLITATDDLQEGTVP